MKSKRLLVAVLFMFFAANNSALAQIELDISLESTNSTTQKLKERIEKIVEEKKQQVQGAINDLSYKKRGFAGEIQRLTQETITIRNEKGTQIIPLKEDLKIFKAGNQISTDAIAVGDWAVILGIVESDEFIAKRIHIHSESILPTSRFVELGTIEEITARSITLKPRSQAENIELTINAKTRFQNSEGEKTVLRDFEENMQVLLIGTESSDSKVVLVLRSLATFNRE